MAREWGAAARGTSPETRRGRAQAGGHAPTPPPEAISAASGFGSPRSASTSGLSLTCLRAGCERLHKAWGRGEPPFRDSMLGEQTAVWWPGLTPRVSVEMDSWENQSCCGSARLSPTKRTCWDSGGFLVTSSGRGLHGAGGLRGGMMAMPDHSRCLAGPEPMRASIFLLLEQWEK